MCGLGAQTRFSNVACHGPHVASGLQFLCISAHVYSADMLILEKGTIHGTSPCNFRDMFLQR